MDGLFLPQVAVIERDLFTTEKKMPHNRHAKQTAGVAQLIREDCPHLKAPDSFIMFI